jgi:hypothetical protein
MALASSVRTRRTTVRVREVRWSGLARPDNVWPPPLAPPVGLPPVAPPPLPGPPATGTRGMVGDGAPGTSAPDAAGPDEPTARVALVLAAEAKVVLAVPTAAATDGRATGLDVAAVD